MDPDLCLLLLCQTKRRKNRENEWWSKGLFSWTFRHICSPTLSGRALCMPLGPAFPRHLTTTSRSFTFCFSFAVRLMENKHINQDWGFWLTTKADKSNKLPSADLSEGPCSFHTHSSFPGACKDVVLWCFYSALCITRGGFCLDAHMTNLIVTEVYWCLELKTPQATSV